MTTHVTDQSADRGSEQIEITVLLVLKTPTVTPSQQTFINSQFFFSIITFLLGNVSIERQ